MEEGVALVITEDVPIVKVPVQAPVQVPVQVSAPVQVQAPVQAPVQVSVPVQAPVQVSAPVPVPVPVPVPEVYTHVRLCAMAEEIKGRNAHILAEQIKTDFLSEFQTQLSHKSGSIWNKTYQTAIDSFALITKLRLSFPDIYIGIWAYQEQAVIKICPWQLKKESEV